jgi:hypothetical protein
VDKVVLDHSDLNPKKAKEVDKLTVVKKANLETVLEREAREEAERLGG